ncbi:PREDICTED: apical endosomal glycoprotein [Tinamus guttatus]|uniref:apical endosomal glycoprotein n=1 Tax=Tinamus guttatus TaxID=94827 RepID=UPI00052EBC3F|nr:PREDICTED: apical endosomal glycoprotein [Tinamus guttatus]
MSEHTLLLVLTLLGYMGVSPVLGTPFTCDFEEGDCGWRDVSTSSYAWVQSRASLAAWGTGPHSDHTVGTDLGWFMAAADPPGKTSATAWLQSPVMREASATCEIQAWYHLSGSGEHAGIAAAGPARLGVLQSSGWGTATVELWQSPERGAEGWHELVAYPGRTTGPFQLSFSVTPSPALGTQLALDDIVFRNCGLQRPGRQVCEAEEGECQRGSCVALECFCDGTDDCGDGSDEAASQCREQRAPRWRGWLPAPSPRHRSLPSAEAFDACTFESGLCLWEAEAGPAAWQRNSSANLAPTPGLPTRDHSNGSSAGYFLHMGSADGVAWLSSPSFQATNSCSVLIEGVAGDAGTVALDDLILSPDCKEEQELSCNFETGMCGWYQDQRSDFQWVRGSEQGQGPDHTTGSGYFLAAAPAAAGTRGQWAQLITAYQQPPAAAQCLSFWYRMAGPQIGTLSPRLQREEEEETVLWTRRGAQGSVWHRGFTTLNPEGERAFRLVFEALRDGFVGSVALDDVTPRAGPCGAPASCSFEAGTCGLVASGQPTWLRQSSDSGAHGPSADHTTRTATGHYMLINTSKGSLPTGHVALLSSELYESSTQAQCLTFWYQLGGEAPGSLSVFVEESGTQRRQLFAVSAMQGSAWHHGQVTVQADQEWRALFEATGGGGDDAYIALDDLHVADGACSEPGSCDFEVDMCGWSSPTDDNPHGFAWGWKSGVPLAKYPGPEQDHTLGTKDGRYVFFDASVLGPGGTTAQLESQHLPAAAASCLHFWYHMDIPEHLPGGELRVRLHRGGGAAGPGQSCPRRRAAGCTAAPNTASRSTCSPADRL